MNHRQSFVTVATVLLLGGALSAADFNLGFRFPNNGGACPTTVQVSPDATEVILDVQMILTTTNNPTPDGGPKPDGAQGWSFGVKVDGAVIDGSTYEPLTIDGLDYYGLELEVSTIYDHDGKPATALRDPWMQNLNTAGFPVFEPAYTTKAPPSGIRPETDVPVGIVTAMVLATKQKQVLQPEGTEAVLQAKLKVAGPFTEAKTVSLVFQDGLYGAGEPVGTVVTHQSASKTPTFTNCTFQVVPKDDKVFQLSVLPLDEPATTVGVNSGEYNVLEKSVQVPEGQGSVDVMIPVIVKLTTAGLPEGDGPQGWSFGMTHESPCMSVNVVDVEGYPTPEIILAGVIVDTIYDHDGKPATPLKEHYQQDLSLAGFPVAEAAYTTKAPEGGIRPETDVPVGAVTAMVLSTKQKQVLYANATDPVLKVIFKATVTKDATTDCKIDITGGLYGSGEPVGNVVTYQSASKEPNVLNGLILRLTGTSGPPPVEKNQFVRGDANNDTKVDIADVVWIVYHVIGDAAYPLACKDAGDANDSDGDPAVNIADAVYLLGYMFKGESAPAVPFAGGCGTDDDSTDTSCPKGSTTCPPVPLP